MENEKCKEIEKELLLYGSDKYPKNGLVESIVNKLESIGFMRIEELHESNNNFGSTWLCCKRILAIRRETEGANKPNLKLKLFDDSKEAINWLRKL